MSFETDIIRNIPHLRSYAVALLRDRDAADDLVQDCLDRALSRRRLFRRGSNLRAWLFTIMHNLYVNGVVRQAGAPDAGPIDNVALPVTASQEARLEMASLARALALLPDEQRQVVLLVGLEQMRYEEAAAVIGVPVGTVMSRLHRGRERLRALMAGNGGPLLSRVK